MPKRRMLESKIEDPVINHTKAQGMKVRKMNGRGYRSWPDRQFFYKKACMFFIEFKKPGEVPTPTQAEIHEELRAMGYVVYVVDNVEIGKDLIDKIILGVLKKKENKQ